MVFTSAPSKLLPSVSHGGLVGLAAGAAVVAGGVSALMTRTDGSRYVHRRYANDYQLQPTSQDAARSSLHMQRILGGLGAAAGVGLSGYGLLAHTPGKDTRIPLFGAVLLGASVGRLLRLSGAEDHINTALPEHTAAGQSDMVRHNMMGWAEDGAGYSTAGIYQGSWFGRDAFSDQVAVVPWEQAPVPAEAVPPIGTLSLPAPTVASPSIGPVNAPLPTTWMPQVQLAPFAPQAQG